MHLLPRHDVLALARPQHGLITRPQLLQLGFSDDSVAGLVRRGRLVIVQRGVYRLAGWEVTRRQELLGAVLRSGEGARAGGAASCALHGLEGFLLPAWPSVLIPHERRLPQTPFPVRRAKLLPADVTTVDGIPCLAGARALLEVAPATEEKALRVGFDSARRQRLLTLDWTLRQARAHPGGA
jgi:hypothetical protein